MIPLWWMLSPNFGDALGPHVVRYLSKDPIVAFTQKTEPHFVVCGSVLNHATEHSTVWGAGLASSTDEVCSGARVLATRGPLSRLRALEYGVAPFEAYGDPGLLVQRMWPATTYRSIGTLLVPHYVDYGKVCLWDCSVVDLLGGSVCSVDAQIAGADRVASSSLHGLVSAAAHGVPFAWVSFGGDDIGGDGFKYRDFFASLRMGEVPVQHVRHPDDVASLRFYQASEQAVTERIEALMEVCPWR